nr:uncharacterized protein LOC108945264 [Nicotiana tomentosiformis]
MLTFMPMKLSEEIHPPSPVSGKNWCGQKRMPRSNQKIEGLDQSSEGYLAGCSNDSKMHLIPKDIAHRDMTLKDINQQIRTTQSKSRQNSRSLYFEHPNQHSLASLAFGRPQYRLKEESINVVRTKV